MPPVTGDVDPSTPADISKVVWVIDPDIRTIYFSGPVSTGAGAPYANAAFQVVTTDGAELGSISTDAQGWLGDSLLLPEGWDSTTNFEVTVVIPGAAGTQHTEGSTTIETPGDPEPSETGTLTDADPKVSSSTDTGLDRDQDPTEPLVPVVSAAPSASAPLPQDPAPVEVVQVSADTDPQAPTSSTAVADRTADGVHAFQALPAENVPVLDASDVTVEQAAQDPSGSEDQQTAAVVRYDDATAGYVGQAAAYVSERLPNTGGPAAVLGAVGLMVTLGGATLVGNSLVGRRRNG